MWYWLQSTYMNQGQIILKMKYFICVTLGILLLCTLASTGYKYSKYSDIPPVKDAARMARYIVHNSDWCVLSHITHQRNTTGYPMGRVFSMSDGPVGSGSGTPYIYTSFFDGVARDLKITGKDGIHLLQGRDQLSGIKMDSGIIQTMELVGPKIEKFFAMYANADNKCAMTMSLVQSSYCKDHDLDPENPRCAQVMLIGNFEFIANGSKEWDFAMEALFSRHPEMKNWPESHGFTFGKLNIANVQIVDYFGGSKYPTVPEYYNASLTSNINKYPKIEFHVLKI